MHRRHRLRTSGDFARVMRAGRRVNRPGFAVYHLAPGRSDVPRVGFSTPRSLGRAVARNRARRRLREAVRPLLPDLVSCDLVVVARSSAADGSVDELGTALVEALTTAGLLREGSRAGGRRHNGHTRPVGDARPEGTTSS